MRQAVADLIDRQALADQVYKGTYTPLYSFVPDGLTGATEPLKEMYGDGQGGPDADKAKKTLEDAGVTTPVELNLQYSNDHYGPSSGDEYALIKDQLEESGLFKVNLQTTEWVQYSKDRTADVYPAYQLGWFPDYSDADNYLTPFFLKENFLGNHYVNQDVEDMILEQAVTADEAKRTELLGQIQEPRPRTCRPSRTCRVRRSRSRVPTSRARRTRSTRRSSSATPLWPRLRDGLSSSRGLT